MDFLSSMMNRTPKSVPAQPAPSPWSGDQQNLLNSLLHMTNHTPNSAPIGDPNFTPQTDHVFQPYGPGTMTLNTMDHPTLSYNLIKGLAARGQSPYNNGQPNYHAYASPEGAIMLEDDSGNGAPMPYKIPNPLPDQPRVNWIHGMNNIPSANRQHLNKSSAPTGFRSV